MRYYTHVGRDNKCIFSGAIKKYGENGFYFGVLEKVKNEKDLNKRERYWINFYQSFKREYGYNMYESTQGLRFKKSEDHKRKISEAHKGKKRSKLEMEGIFNSKFIGNSVNKHVPVEMIDPITNEVVGVYLSVNLASKDTNIPRRSIDYVVHNTPFFNKSKTKLHYMTLAGGYKWRKINIKPTDTLWEIKKNCYSYKPVLAMTTISSKSTCG
jgi:group I intron endonuclease